LKASGDGRGELLIRQMATAKVRLDCLTGISNIKQKNSSGASTRTERKKSRHFNSCPPNREEHDDNN
jgi:hypothetical protein